MSYDKCPRCGEYGFAVEECPCRQFWVYQDEDSAAENEGGECVWASDAEKAAVKCREKWAYFDSSYCDDGDMWVRDGNCVAAQHYEIHVEWLPHFSAALVSDGAAEKQQ